MEVVGSSLVVTLDIVPGVRVAAAWSGGEYVQIHSVSRGGFGAVLDRIRVWDDWADAPMICPTLQDFEQFVEARLRDIGPDSYVSSLAESLSDFEESRSDDVFASIN